MFINLVPRTSEHLAIMRNDQTKNWISQNPDMRSIILHLHHPFEWPLNIVFNNLEKLEIHSSESRGFSPVPTISSLIGNVPNLKQLTIQNTRKDQVAFSLQQFNKFLASVPQLEELTLDFPNIQPFQKFCNPFVDAIQTWHHPKLISLTIEYGTLSPSILHNFPTSFHQLRSFTSHTIGKIDDQAIVALSQLHHLHELRLPSLIMINTDFSRLITRLPSIAILEIASIQNCGLPIFRCASHLLLRPVHLRELRLDRHPYMTEDDIDLITNNVPSKTILIISVVSKVDRPHMLFDFLKSSADIQNLEIRLRNLESIEAVLDEVRNSGGPLVEMEFDEDTLNLYAQSVRLPDL